ncbi:hypothetical protein PMZ80_009349 [Knufia obscura]|uniref:Fumarylacetoacetase-like C-terminal domain-containing protein n=1 Tax=Knufia obscura TaxID=1635080 RepID=A0ABR0RE41_9EURO|nr:hypothetical protein PMZ80_009349 [Knufia obscura]
MASWKRLVRFVPKSDSSKVLIGQPTDDDLDVGLALRDGKEVTVDVFSGSSVLSPGQSNGQNAVIDRVLSPLTQVEAGTIRCVGLNYKQHAAEAKMDLPPVPTLFMKPQTALADPWPAPTVLPKQTLETDSGDFESELAVVIGKTCKNVSEGDAMDYVLGYTASNDISSRAAQFAQTQWSYSKGFDGSCPIGPTIVSPTLIPDPAKLKLRGLGNDGSALQECGLDDLIFSIPKIISFLSQSTTLPPGTVIITGTPAGVGFAKKPKYTLKPGEEFRVEILPYIGTLCSVFEAEK